MATLGRADVVARLRAAGCVFAEDEAELLVSEARTPTELDALVERRAAGEPLEHVLGWAEFCDRRVVVDRGVFVPRRRTELLVAEAAVLAGPGAVVIDLCCGSGAVGLALQEAVGALELYAVDIDPVAVLCARRNLAPRGHVFQGDLFEPLPPALRGHVDIIVANAPYVPTDSIGLMPAEAREHEPLVALDGGLDGLDIQRRVIEGAVSWLAPGGHLLVETSRDQAPGTVDAFTANGLTAQVATSDDLDATVVRGALVRRPEA